MDKSSGQAVSDLSTRSVLGASLARGGVVASPKSNADISRRDISETVSHHPGYWLINARDSQRLMRELGWIENRTIAIEYRWTEGTTIATRNLLRNSFA